MASHWFQIVPKDRDQGRLSDATKIPATPTRITDPRGNSATYRYDGFGNLNEQASPDSGITTYRYDEVGNPIARTDARGVTVGHTYDALNRLDAIIPASASACTMRRDALRAISWRRRAINHGNTGARGVRRIHLD